MRNKHCSLLTLTLSMFAAALHSSALAGTANIANLGTLGGGQSYGLGINRSGQVAGYSSLTPGKSQRHAFLYTGTPGSDGAMLDLGTLGGVESYGIDINDAGQVVGTSSPEGLAPTHAFRYTGIPGSGGAMVDLGTLGGTISSGNAINAAGQVAGQSDIATGPYHAFLYTGTPGSGGVMHDLGTLFKGNIGYSAALGLNDVGQVTGDSFAGSPDSQHAFLYTGTPGSGGEMLDLGTLGGTRSSGDAINNAGKIAGSSRTTGDAAWHAFLYTGMPGSGGSMADLGTLGGTNSFGRDISTFGHIVGDSETVGGASHAFLYVGTPGSGGAMTDLDVRLDTNNPADGAKWTLTLAWALNDAGRITGWGEYDDGPGGLSDGTRAFILDASSLVPEPSCLALLSLGAPSLRRRGHRG